MKRLLSTIVCLSICSSMAVYAVARDDEKGTPTASEKKDLAKKKATSASHKQVRKIKPMHDGKPIALNTFCLDSQNNILACVGGDTQKMTMGEDGSGMEMKVVSQPKLVQKYSPDGKLIAAFKLDFQATAINTAKDGSIFVAGEGYMARLSSEGNVLTESGTPQIEDMDAFKKKVAEAAKKQMTEFLDQYKEMEKQAKDKIAELEKVEEDDRTASQKAQLKMYKQQDKIFSEQITMMKDSAADMFGPEMMLKQKLAVTGIAVTDKDVFVTCGSLEGYGYSVWRTDHKFENAKQVMDDVSGCCGQLDIQASGDKLFVAENSRFRVRICDRDGKDLSKFGSRDRKAADGFGSCCNPMNVRCCQNGDILTAESSIGNIKRFDADGKFLGFVGKATIGGGCKHVAIGFDETRNHYYMMNVDKGHICVLVPLSEAPEFTEDELAAKEAREGLGRKLIGKWELKPAGEKKDKEPADEAVGMFAFPTAKAFDFAKDGTMKTVGGMFSTLQNNNEEEGDETLAAAVQAPDLGWVAVKQTEKTLVVSQLMDGVANYDFKIEFVSNDEIKVAMVFSEQEMASATYVRSK